jgi:hypothetical protein
VEEQRAQQQGGDRDQQRHQHCVGRSHRREQPEVDQEAEVRTVESTLAEPEDGRLCLVLAKLTLGSLLDALPQPDEEDE